MGRENKFNADQRLEQMTSIKEKLHFKDEEMIRLSHECEERHKEVLQLTQEVDRLRHYESKAQSNAIVQQHTNGTIAKLRQQIAQLKQKSCASDDRTTAEVATSAGDEQAVSPQTHDDDNRHDNGDKSVTGDDTDVAIEASEAVTDDSPPGSPSHLQIFDNTHIPTEEAMEKLQERFTRTMSDIADLTEEKNRLEHLCTQLQGETETIGEYIALYQCQRQQLKQRERERDVQMQTIVHDREEMRLKLVQLNELVERLIGGHSQNDEQQTHSAADSEAEAHDIGTTPILPPNLVTDDDLQMNTTATEILQLLGEIQDRNQRKEPCSQSLTDVHKCACCYGKLETV